jgi:hypothetical protein
MHKNFVEGGEGEGEITGKVGRITANGITELRAVLDSIVTVWCVSCVWVCVCVGFVMYGCVCVCVGLCMCGFCNVWVCVCVCGFVYVWVL